MTHIKPLSTETWSDFTSLMQSDNQCAECWCLNHRLPSGCPTGLAAREKMRILIEGKEVEGLLAYSDGECIGWLSIDPISKLVGHDCLSTGKVGELAIHCIFVKENYRGKGISKHLIENAIQYAHENGAKLISAFPIPEENRGKFPVNEAEFSGRFSTFQKLGFKQVENFSEFYQRVELQVE
jgi:GNAT superfamily N-acetyltransferase